MSFHLATLERAGLVRSWRYGRRVLYAASYDDMRQLLAFLTEDCCSGNPDICGDPIKLAPPPLHGRRFGTTSGGGLNMTVIIYHNPACGTSRNTLEMIRQSGETPEVIEYLQTPPTRAKLTELIADMGMVPRDLLREKDTPYAELRLDNRALTDDQLLDAMMAHPILINRPIVVTDKGTALCRPSEKVLDLLANPVASFTKEDGEIVGRSGTAA